MKINSHQDSADGGARVKRGKSLTSAKSKKPLKALASVLTQNVEVKNLVDDAAADLSSVNAGLKQAIEQESSPPHVEHALVISETAGGKVQEAADKLAVVNSALEDAVNERHALEIQLAEVTEREERSRHASFHDPLTALPNRALSYDRLAHGVAQARRHGWHLAVMFIDLDDFKKINDQHGHDVGDQVLRALATRLANSTRDDDTLSRHGGDEFLYVLTEYESEQDLTAIAEKLIALIEVPCVTGVGDAMIETVVSPSIGIAVFPRQSRSWHLRSVLSARIRPLDSACCFTEWSDLAHPLHHGRRWPRQP